MFGLFRREPKRSVEDDLIPALRNNAAQIQETTGVSYLAVAAPMLTFGVSLIAKDNGLPGLAQAISTLTALLENEKRNFGSLGSSILGVKMPDLPQRDLHAVIDRLGDFASRSMNRGYSAEEIGAAMASVSGLIANLIDKDHVLAVGLLESELERRRGEYKREQFRMSASGERCTDEAISILVQAEADGYAVSIERDRTFVVSKPGVGVLRLRSSADILRFGTAVRDRQEVEHAKANPIDKLIERGRKLLETQDLEGAVSAFSAALRIKPDSRDAYYYRALAWSNSFHNKGGKPGDRQKAIDDYTKSVEIDPGFTEGYFQRAGLLSDQGRVEQAMADYGKAIDGNHKASTAYYCRALLWQSTGAAGLGRAIADLDGAVRTGDKHDQFMALIARGEALTASGQIELALADFDAAAAYYPKSPPGLYQKRAAIFLKLGRIREAAADFGEGIAASSPFADRRFVADMYEQRGRCRKQLGEAELARHDFDCAAKIRRENP